MTTYLDAFATNNSYGSTEGHAAWNQLMLSGAQDVQGYYNSFSGSTLFYPGDYISFTLENGTTITDRYLGVYWSQGPTGPLATGGDFYNFFVLGFWPASFDPTSDVEGSGGGAAATGSFSSAAATPTPTPTTGVVAPAPSGWGTDEFWYPPSADIAQPDLGAYEGGYITGAWEMRSNYLSDRLILEPLTDHVSGYLLNSSATAVLSVPSLDMYGEKALNTAQTAVDQFINMSKAGNVEKIVIDLQQNTGGEALLAFDLFKRFFPNIDPYGASQMRAHHAADIMGGYLTAYYAGLSTQDPDYEVLAANEWIALPRINVETGTNFSSWTEFYGPYEYNGDSFTTQQRYNLSSEVFTSSAIGEQYGSFRVYDPSPEAVPPYTAENIVMVSSLELESPIFKTIKLILNILVDRRNMRVSMRSFRRDDAPSSGCQSRRCWRSPHNRAHARCRRRPRSSVLQSVCPRCEHSLCAEPPGVRQLA